jgi:DNA-binding NtrC family response regulator
MEDVPMLAEHFLEMYAEKYKGKANKFSQKAFDQMLNYNWRGNVRELQHTIERAVLLCKTDTITELNIPKTSSEQVSFSFSAPSEGSFESDTVVSNFSALGGGNGDGHGIHFPGNLDGEKLFEEVGKLIVDNLPEPGDGVDQKDVFDSLETGVVLAALRRTNGNKQAAANLLGLYRPRLYGMIKRHNLEEKI